MTKTIALFAAASLLLVSAAIAPAAEKQQKQSAKEKTVLDQKMKSLEGKELDLGKYRGKVVLIVNVASQCGFTPQYEGLEALHEKYADKGLAILGFPCNQFGGQEPGTAKEIRKFCSTQYGVKFDMFAKVEVNGDGQCNLYKQLTMKDAGAKFPGKIKWNFEKFVIGRNGKVVARFESATAPDDPKLIATLDRELSAK